MKLGCMSNGNYKELRDLTPDELSKHEYFTPIFVEARNRLRVFNMLEANYQEWRSYTQSLLTTHSGNHEEEQLYLDRLLLNHLTCAYTIHEHFDVSFRRRFKKN